MYLLNSSHTWPYNEVVRNEDRTVPLLKDLSGVLHINEEIKDEMVSVDSQTDQTLTQMLMTDLRKLRLYVNNKSLIKRIEHIKT